MKYLFPTRRRELLLTPALSYTVRQPILLVAHYCNLAPAAIARCGMSAQMTEQKAAPISGLLFIFGSPCAALAATAHTRHLPPHTPTHNQPGRLDSGPRRSESRSAGDS